MKIDNILNESREWRRVEVDIPAQGKLLDPAGKAFASQVININPDGMCFLAPEGILAGQTVQLEMELPAVGKLQVRMLVVWAGYFEQSKSYRAGGKFEALPEKEKAKFLRFYHLKVMSLLGG